MPERRAAKKHSRLMILLTAGLFVLGAFLLLITTVRLPDLSDLADLKQVQSTKIYDRTGQILLYDLSPNVSRTAVPYEDISQNIKNATIAIEDKNFYHHGGIVLSALIRALLVDISTLSFSQGGSTITQQVIKNTVLTSDKSITRKLKELVLATKLDGTISKDEILNLYLNSIPYGGKIYGVEEASENFFGVAAKNVDLAQAAYLGAIIEAPTYYSPHGQHRSALDGRKNLVLKDMLDQGMITESEYQSALKENVVFKPVGETSGIKAPHFVFFVVDYLAQKYGEDALQNNGFKITTTLDYDIQQKAEAVSEEYGEKNLTSFNANNNAIVVIDPKTGDILAMVGSRDYYNQDIDGNFNVATAHRQPGSTFKPFVYATLFNKGYTPDTILFDTPIQFAPKCLPTNLVSDSNGCYSPVDYDGQYRGPMTIRNALAQSINIPAVQALYLAGINNSIDTAHKMGVQSLTDANQYGLTLVLGGGEVSLLDMTSAYSVFANDGVRNPYNPILKVNDAQGNILEEHTPNPEQVLPEQTAREITSILTDNVARTPAYGASSVLYVPTRQVAVKTGTTNDYKDAWIMGYAPNITVGAWVGNSNNTPMDKKVAGYIVAPMWRALMDKILPNLPAESFSPPNPVDPTLKPVLRGVWQGGVVTLNPDGQTETVSGGVHTILNWLSKSDPLGPAPLNPAQDPQYNNWEYSVRLWAATHGQTDAPLVLPVQNPTNVGATTFTNF
jgi:1A family penicillin-binding protein